MSQRQTNKSGRTKKHQYNAYLKQTAKEQELGKYASARTTNERARIMKEMQLMKKRNKATEDFLKGVPNAAQGN